MRLARYLLAAALLLPFVAADSTTTVQAANSGYLPAATLIASGDSVQWHSIDDTHVTIDTPVLGGDPCFIAVSQEDTTSDPVRFDLIGGVLYATQADETLACPSALVTPASAALAYHCLIHPLMRGTLVVSA